MRMASARRVALLCAFALLVLLGAFTASATPIGPTTLQVLGSGSRSMPETSNSTIGAQGGNVTQVNIDALSVTKSWQGYYGNITGNIHLDNALNQSFYIWGNGTLTGEVYATRNGTVLWGEVNCSNVTQRDSEDAYLGVIASDGDSAVSTFNVTTHPTFYVGTQSIGNNTCFSTNLFVNGTKSTDSFYEVLLSDNQSTLIYTALIEDDSYAYNAQLADFQLMVGENEHIGNIGPTTYYFWIELS